jgi:F-type H+-transporting ATPase subunit delta
MSTQQRHLARPYAEAIFRLAEARGELAKWSATLALLAAIAGDERVRARLSDPRLTREEAARLVLDIAGRRLNREGANLVRVLAEYRRLPLLPEIASLYEARRAEAEGRITAQVTSAHPLSPAQERLLKEALERQFARRVALEPAVDPSLLGGVVVRVGDLVIDGSVRRQVERLAAQLSH